MDLVERLTVHLESTLAQAMSAMDHVGIGLAMVLDETGRLIGIVTDGDIRRALLGGIDLNDSIEGIITRDPVILADAVERDIAILRLLQSEGFQKRSPGLIPLVGAEGQPIDLISLSEILRSDIAVNLQRALAANHLGKVLIIGGAGYIGSILARQLLKAGYHVKILDLLLYGHDSLGDLESNPAYEFLQGDTRHIETLMAAIQGVSSVIHLAELVGDPLCARNPVVTLQTNYLSTFTIAEICSYLQINRFIYTSSCSVYGAGVESNLLDENSTLAPLSLYAKLKINSERAILGMNSSNFSPCILRLGTAFGVSPRMRFDLVVNTLTAQAFFERRIRIFGGDQWRPHVHVSDVANAIQLVLESSIEKVAGQAFNIIGENLKIRTLGELVSARLSAQVEYEEITGDLRNYRVSGEKAQKTLGFMPSMSVANGIDELATYLERGEILDYKDKRYSNVEALSEWVQS